MTQWGPGIKPECRFVIFVICMYVWICNAEYRPVVNNNKQTTVLWLMRRHALNCVSENIANLNKPGSIRSTSHCRCVSKSQTHSTWLWWHSAMHEVCDKLSLHSGSDYIMYSAIPESKQCLDASLRSAHIQVKHLSGWESKALIDYV